MMSIYLQIKKVEKFVKNTAKVTATITMIVVFTAVFLAAIFALPFFEKSTMVYLNDFPPFIIALTITFILQLLGVMMGFDLRQLYNITEKWREKWQQLCFLKKLLKIKVIRTQWT